LTLEHLITSHWKQFCDAVLYIFFGRLFAQVTVDVVTHNAVNGFVKWIQFVGEVQKKIVCTIRPSRTTLKYFFST